MLESGYSIGDHDSQKEKKGKASASPLRIGALLIPCAVAAGIALGTWATRNIRAAAQEKAAAESSEGLKIFKLHLAGEEGYTLFVEVAGSQSRSLPRGNAGERWEVAAFRFSPDHKSVEHFESIGAGSKISDTQLVVKLHEERKARLKDESDKLSSGDPLVRRALIFFPKGSQHPRKAYRGTSIEAFDRAIRDEVKAGALIAYPIESGSSRLATTCTCKAFFGCTTGCCTNPTCKVIAGWCQDNDDCKRVDSTSSCACRKD